MPGTAAVADRWAKIGQAATKKKSTKRAMGETRMTRCPLLARRFETHVKGRFREKFTSPSRRVNRRKLVAGGETWAYDLPNCHLISPPTIVVTARPVTCQPSKGQLRLLPTNLHLDRPFALGSMIVTSATAPARSVPRSSLTIWAAACSSARSVSSRRCGRAHQGLDVQGQGAFQADDAEGAANSSSFSSAKCGA